MAHPPVREFVILVFDGARMSDVAGITETLSEHGGAGSTRSVTLVSVTGEDAVASNGFRIPVGRAAARVGTVDTFLVVGTGWLPQPLIPAELAAAARTLSGHARRTAAVGTGAFILGAAGLLDGKRATTDHRSAAALSKRHPLTNVRVGETVAKDGTLFTSAGADAGIEVTRALLRDDGIIRRSSLHGVVAAVTGDPARPYTAETLAEIARVSSRTLSRLFRTEYGVTPAKYVESVRISTAKTLLDAGHNITRAAQDAGFGTTETLRRAFHAHFEISPSAYQRRSSARG